MAKLMSKSELIQKIADQHSNMTRKDIKGVIESLAEIGYKGHCQVKVFYLKIGEILGTRGQQFQF